MKKGERFLVRAIGAIALLFAAYVGLWAWLNIRADYPMEYRENAMLLSVDLQVQGVNPYAMETRPVYQNMYGIGYLWACYPFARVFGNTFLVLRLVSCAFVVASAALLFWALRIDKCSWPSAATAALLLFSELGQGLSIVSRPDSLGTFLFVASLLIPYRYRFRPAAL